MYYMHKPLFPICCHGNQLYLYTERWHNCIYTVTLVTKYIVYPSKQTRFYITAELGTWIFMNMWKWIITITLQEGMTAWIFQLFTKCVNLHRVEWILIFPILLVSIPTHIHICGEYLRYSYGVKNITYSQILHTNIIRSL